MKNKFNSIFKELLNCGISAKQAMQAAWQIVKLQGKKVVTFERVRPKKNSYDKDYYSTTRYTSGIYDFKVSKDKDIIILFKDDREFEGKDTRSFRLNYLVSAQ